MIRRAVVTPAPTPTGTPERPSAHPNIDGVRVTPDRVRDHRSVRLVLDAAPPLPRELTGDPRLAIATHVEITVAAGPGDPWETESARVLGRGVVNIFWRPRADGSGWPAGCPDWVVRLATWVTDRLNQNASLLVSIPQQRKGS